MSIHTDKQKQTLDLSNQDNMGAIIKSIDDGEYKKWWNSSSDALSWQGIVQYLPAIKLALSDTATFNDEQKAFLVSRLDHFSRLCRAYVESHGGVGGFKWTAVGKKRVELAQELFEAANRKMEELAPEKKVDLSDNMPLPEVGMQNPANACYMISTLQQLFRLPSLKEFFERNVFCTPADTISKPEGMNDTAFAKLKADIRKAVNAGKSIESINKPTEIGSDEWDKIKDAAILYHARCLFDMIKFSKNNVPLSTSTTSKHLRALGYDRSQEDARDCALAPILAACRSFGFHSTDSTTKGRFKVKNSDSFIDNIAKPEISPYRIIHLPEKNNSLSINDCFKAAFIAPMADGSHVCGTEVDTSITKLTACPENLIINLGRYTVDENYRSKKLNNSVSGLEEIDLTPYLDEEVFVVSENPEETTKRAKYKLFGAQIHRGSTNRGHYYSYIRKSVTSDAWIKYNDGTVSECKYDGIKNDIATQGYILYYVRVEEPEKRAKNNGTK